MTKVRSIMSQRSPNDVRKKVRTFLHLLPPIVFVVGLASATGGVVEFLFAGHWLLIPFIPIYVIWNVVVVSLTTSRPQRDARTGGMNTGAAQGASAADVESAVHEAMTQFLAGAKVTSRCPACAGLLRASHAQRPNVIVVACKCGKCRREFPGPREPG
jgi:hypothetical protein